MREQLCMMPSCCHVVLEDRIALDHVLGKGLPSFCSDTAGEAGTEQELGDADRGNGNLERTILTREGHFRIECATFYLDEHTRIEKHAPHRSHGSSIGLRRSRTQLMSPHQLSSGSGCLA